MGQSFTLEMDTATYDAPESIFLEVFETFLQPQPSEQQTSEPALTEKLLVLSTVGMTQVVRARGTLSYFWEVQGFCLNISSNRQPTPSQSSHNPRAEQFGGLLEPIFDPRDIC